jgi:hypothetical protein
MTDAPRSGAPSPQESVVSGLADRAQTLASNVASSAQDKARKLVEDQKNAAAEQVEEVARVIEGAAEQVERVLPEAGHYVREAASGVHRVSSAVRDQSIDDLIDMGRDFVRTRPGTFLAGSVLVGFALARFLKASADRRSGAGAGGPAGRGRQTAGARTPSRSRPAGQTAAPGGPGGNAEDSAAGAYRRG